MNSSPPPEAPFLKSYKVVIDTGVLLAWAGARHPNGWFPKKYLPHIVGSIYTCDVTFTFAFDILSNPTKRVGRKFRQHSLKRLLQLSERLKIIHMVDFRKISSMGAMHSNIGFADAYLCSLAMSDPQIIIMSLNPSFETYGVRFFGINGYFEPLNVDLPPMGPDQDNVDSPMPDNDCPS